MASWAEFETDGPAYAADHVHMLISIPPKYAVSQVIGYMKGKSAIHIARTYARRKRKKRNFVGQHFWARGYFVSTVGRDETVVREYIRAHEQEDRRQDQTESRLERVAAFRRLKWPSAAMSTPL